MSQSDRLLVCILLLACCTAVWAAPPTENAAALRGISRRAPWTTSKISGTPDPPAPYKVELAFPHLTFDRPLLLTNAPGTDRLFVAERTGKIFSFVGQPDCRKRDLVIDLKQQYPKFSFVYGMTFHPDYARNRYVYVCYVVSGRSEQERQVGTRVVRYKMSATDPPQIDADSEQLIIAWRGGGHNGGCLKFGPDGYLYISSGDGAGPSPPDPLRSGQNLGNLLSAILRIDVDTVEEGKAYSTPPDNPFVDVVGARPEIWAYGLRNPWKMSFDRANGDLWVGDVGWEQWEMIYRIEKGGNYGWSIMEGRQVVRPEGQRGPTPILPPTVDHPHSEAASITGGFVYHGDRLKALRGAYIYGDYQTGIVWALRHDGEKVTSHEEIAHTPVQLVAFGEDNQGELYLLDHDRTKQIYRLVKNPDTGKTHDFPRKLSETGLFTSVAGEVPAPGVLEYSIVAPHWADHTKSRRWLAIPGGKAIEIEIDEKARNKGAWLFPDGAVAVKTVSMEMERGVPASRRRLETQILHREQGSWRPYTYVWNDEQTDAVLADKEGFSRTLKIADDSVPGGIREQTHRFAARSECLLCHNPWVETQNTVFGVQTASALGLNRLQLDREGDFGGAAGVRANQLAALRHWDMLRDQSFEQKSNARLVDPYDEGAPLADRARSYLHVNCAHCHQYNAGGTANILLALESPLARTQMVGVRPTQGTFGIAGARIIAPGDPLRSVLYYRLAKLGGGRMPRLGSREVDLAALRMFHDWIAEMPAGDKPPAGLSAADSASLDKLRAGASPEELSAAIAQLCGTTRGALALMQATVDNQLPRQTMPQVVALTKNHPRAQVRDLFERFVPPSERIKRLGTVVNQTEILNLEADPRRGEQVFFSESAAACQKCHKVGKRGETLGPDLGQIGKKYRRDALLVHILEPSKFMEPKYVPQLLETTDGRVLTGLLVSKNDDKVVLKNAQNKLVEVAADDVEVLVPQQKSLMPDLLLRDMTPQQVADLLAFLASLK